jgi:hypothetical protein
VQRRDEAGVVAGSEVEGFAAELRVLDGFKGVVDDGVGFKMLLVEVRIVCFRFEGE